MVSTPPCGIASRALTARFTTTCSRCLGSMRTSVVAASERGVNTNVHAEQLLEHAVERSDDRVEVDRLRRFEHRAAAEDQELPRERRGPAADFEHLVQIVLQVRIHRLVVADLLERQLGVADEGGEEVVEVVRDAAGQPAERVHLLGLPKLIFQALSFGDVARDTQHRGQGLVPLLGDLERHHVGVDPPLAAGEADDPKLPSGRGAGAGRTVHLEISAPVSRVDEVR